MRASGIVKAALIRVGQTSGSPVVGRVRNAATYLRIGEWLSISGSTPKIYAHREQLFEVGARRLQPSAMPLYLEFGVFEGASIKWWSSRIDTPQARFIGFDSFQGLPHAWDAGSNSLGKGAFAVSKPEITDPRVTFVEGWFDTTLTDFDPPRHDSLFVTLDADLYSSTVTVLDAIGMHLVPGTLIYFDEFPEGEFDAMTDWSAREERKIRAIGCDRTRRAWLVEVV